VEERIDVPVTEMAYVLDKYNDWSNHYSLSPALQKETYEFFEKQTRELGTRSHDLAKVTTDPDKKAQPLRTRAPVLHLYLGFFEKGPPPSRSRSTSLTSITTREISFRAALTICGFILGNSATRTKSGPRSKRHFIATKPAEYAYYEQLRAKGMMVKAISSYMALDPKKKADPALNFALAKIYFEQGYYDKASRISWFSSSDSPPLAKRPTPPT